MGKISGIKVELDTATESWAPTRDALFLGVYSKFGGREFRLNDGISLNIPEQEIALALGDSCCRSDDEVQVQYSTALGDNDPLLNPIILEEVEFVYLRKETADSTVTNDDVYKLDGCIVTLCDAAGGIRRFQKDGSINFSDETGLQHWLRETDPPRCTITVQLTAIIHEREPDKNPAGRKWYFDFGFRIGGQNFPLLDDEFIKKPKRDSEWEEPFNTADTAEIVGCCGNSYDVEIYGEAREKDFFRDDPGKGSTTLRVQCTPELVKTTNQISFVVKGNSKNRASKITFVFDVSSVCHG